MFAITRNKKKKNFEHADKSILAIMAYFQCQRQNRNFNCLH